MFNPTRGPDHSHVPHAHPVQFYRDDAVLLDGLSQSIGATLEAGKSGVVIATPAHRSGLAERLPARGLDLARATARGQYAALDATDTLAWFLVDRLPDSET